MSDLIETEVEPVVTDLDKQLTEPEVNPEMETLRRDLEAAQLELETTKNTLTATATERDRLLLSQLKAEVARENGLPAGVLAGNDRAELEAHAETLKEWQKAQPTRTGPARQSRSGLAGGYMPTLSGRERAAQALRNS
ncbi:hypothetical protein QM588_05135 [Rhodococcus sp. IEGM 1354]|uniref:hypothetical protein n=1 Tax=Rhodococcus sp. IEGM 1354 TaxID=3047088 RepID=UPI0024B820D8|nr:hypothetical protein [Rhodococcus sp. IEGM 1354]MDI9929781.1 hypothetical protein [Rhodococcus sp. IEGM 1354]